MIGAVAPRTTAAMSAGRLVQYRMPASSTPSPLIVEMRARVLEDLHAVLRERRRHLVVVVVIAEDREDAVRRRQRRQRVGGRADVLPIAPRHVIAAEDDQIRPFLHQHRHGVRDVLVRDPAAAMDVGEQADPKSAEGRGKARHTDGFPRDPQLMALVRESRTHSSL